MVQTVDVGNAPWIQRRLQREGYSPSAAASAASKGDELGVIAQHAEDSSLHSGSGGGEDDPPLHSFALIFENALV